MTYNIEIETGIIYRNKTPHLKSKHAYFPSVVRLPNGNLMASFVIGEAFESVNLNTYTSISIDNGLEWSDPIPIVDNSGIGSLRSNVGRLAVLQNGELVSMVVQCLRDEHPAEGLANPITLGFVPTEIFITKSDDQGLTWTTLRRISPALEGPSFESCSSIIILEDGRWLWPTSTWRGWDGYSPNGMKMVALVSYDKGETWPDYMDIMNGNSDQVIFWEGKVCPLKNGNLLAISWAFDEKNGKDLPNHFAILDSSQGNWSAPKSTGILGQTMAVTELSDQRLLVVYRRMDKGGLWAKICRISSSDWIIEQEYCLWGNQSSQLNSKSGEMVKDFNELKFGAPWITPLEDNTFFICFWCYENLVSNIRWIKIKI